MLIGFSQNTSKIFARICCRHFRHCVVLFHNADITGQRPTNDKYILVQIGADGVRLLCIDKAGIDKLTAHGWVFVPAKPKTSIQISAPINLLTCVGFAKRALGIRTPFIWTPDQLYRYLNKKAAAT